MALTQVQGGMLAGSTNTTTTIQSNGTTAITIDSSQKVGIGTTTPTTNLQVGGSGSGTFGVYNDPLIVKGSAFTYVHLLGTDDQAGILYNRNGSTGWFTGLDNSGRYKFAYMPTMNQSGLTTAKDTGSPNLLLDTSGSAFLATTNTAPSINNVYGIALNRDGSGNYGAGICQFSANGSAAILLNRGSDDGTTMAFRRTGTQVGAINVTGSSTSYATSSDYRLKENVAPMTGALAKVAQLKPVTYKWKLDGSDGQGFIAHELQEVVPDAVSGEKDAVDSEGGIVAQGIDTSFLVATLTAAIQELNAKVEAQAAEIAALKAVK